MSEDGQGVIVPAQAQRWETSEDELVWRFCVRPQLKWSNGEPLTARDFVYAWAAAAESGAGPPLACCWRPASPMPSPFMPVRSISMPWGWRRKRQILKVTLERPVPISCNWSKPASLRAGQRTGHHPVWQTVDPAR